jgi:hypothetical protein
LLVTVGLLLCCVAALGQGEGRAPGGEGGRVVRFAAYDVFVDCGDVALAAWQVDVHGAEGRNAGSIAIVGIEGGEHEAFARPPHYDPRAMQHDRVILGAFSTADEDALPRGRTRVARIHVRLEGPEGFEPEFDVRLETASAPLGAVVDGEVSIEKGERP